MGHPPALSRRHQHGPVCAKNRSWWPCIWTGAGAPNGDVGKPLHNVPHRSLGQLFLAEWPLPRAGLLGRRPHAERPLRPGRIGDFEEQRADHRRNDAKEGQSIEAAGIAASQSLTTPTYQGPKKPPRLPSELIHAIEAAAAAPVMNIGGIDQNGPFEP